MNWYDTRKQWNRDGQCARQACRGPLPVDHEWFNTGNHLRYCDDCAPRINRYNPGIVERREVGK